MRYRYLEYPLTVDRLEGKRLLHRDLGEEMFTSLGKFRTAVRMQPGGKFVACVLTKKTLVVVSVADGSEMLRVVVGSCLGLWWSPDGALLAVGTTAGARVFAMDRDFAVVQCLDSTMLVIVAIETLGRPTLTPWQLRGSCWSDSMCTSGVHPLARPS